MKFSSAVAGIAIAVAFTASAQAQTVYDTIGGISDTAVYSPAGYPSYSVETSQNSVLADQFLLNTNSNETIFSIGVYDANPADNGSFVAELLNDNGGLPGSNVLASAVVHDSDLVSGDSIISGTYSGALTAGQYWVELLSTGTSSVSWLKSTNLLGADIGATNEANDINGVVVTNSDSFFPTLEPLQLEVTVPEPASLAVFGAALAGLSALRRRRQ